MSWKLLETFDGPMLPRAERSPGLHMSELVHDVAVGREWLKAHSAASDSDALPWKLWEEGLMWERSVAEWLERNRDHTIIHGEGHLMEQVTWINGIEIFYTPDIIETNGWLNKESGKWSIWECKRCGCYCPADIKRYDNPYDACRQQADRYQNLVNTLQRFELQLKAYCYAFGSTRGVLAIDFPYGAGDRKPIRGAWDRVYNEVELRQNWFWITQALKARLAKGVR